MPEVPVQRDKYCSLKYSISSPAAAAIMETDMAKVLDHEFPRNGVDAIRKYYPDLQSLDGQ